VCVRHDRRRPSHTSALGVIKCCNLKKTVHVMMMMSSEQQKKCNILELKTSTRHLAPCVRVVDAALQRQPSPPLVGIIGSAAAGKRCCCCCCSAAELLLLAACSCPCPLCCRCSTNGDTAMARCCTVTPLPAADAPFSTAFTCSPIESALEVYQEHVDLLERHLQRRTRPPAACAARYGLRLRRRLGESDECVSCCPRIGCMYTHGQALHSPGPGSRCSCCRTT